MRSCLTLFFRCAHKISRIKGKQNNGTYLFDELSNKIRFYRYVNKYSLSHIYSKLTTVTVGRVCIWAAINGAARIRCCFLVSSF